jgi:hypothetical protein
MTAGSRPASFWGKVALLAFFLSVPRPTAAQWMVEYFRGTALSVPSPLTINQDGYPPIEFTAHYSTRPFDDRAYYAVRIAHWHDQKGWILEELHHKVYLDNPQGEVEHFEVTHGYNLVTLNRGWRWGGNLVMLGGGAVVTFPHSTIRGLTYPQDTTQYHLSGVTVQGAVGHQFHFSRHVFASVEAKLTASWARVPIVDGNAHVPNAAFHVLAGLGGQF